MSTLSRRSLVASAAAIPAALAVPAFAVAAEPDPIFAAIEAFERAQAQIRGGSGAIPC